MLLVPQQQQLLAVSLATSNQFWTYNSWPTSVDAVFCPRRVYRSRFYVPKSTYSRVEDDKEVGGVKDESFTRRHNSKSSALLLRRYVPSQHQYKEEDGFDREVDISNSIQKMAGTALSKGIRMKRVDFPGSVDRRDFNSPLEAFVDEYNVGSGVDGDSTQVMRTVEMCRSLVADILREMLMGPKAKLSKTYTSNLVPLLGAFVDRVVVAAAYMKSTREFSHATFEARAKAYIENSKLVPLVRYDIIRAPSFVRICLKFFCLCLLFGLL